MARNPSAARSYKPHQADATDLHDVPDEHVVNRRIILTERGAEQVLAAISSDSEIPPLPPALQALRDRGRPSR